MPDESTCPIERVKAAMAAKRPPARRDVEHALRVVFGLSVRQARKFAASGLKGLGIDDAADLAEVAARVKRLEASLKT